MGFISSIIGEIKQYFKTLGKGNMTQRELDYREGFSNGFGLGALFAFVIELIFAIYVLYVL